MNKRYESATPHKSERRQRMANCIPIIMRTIIKIIESSTTKRQEIEIEENSDEKTVPWTSCIFINFFSIWITFYFEIKKENGVFPLERENKGEKNE